MLSVRYKAPAKVILSGEHAVVYGKPACIAGLGIYTTITVSESATSQIPHPKIVGPVMDAVLKHLKIKQHRPISIAVESDVPVGRGLGSSAAFAVALTAALLHVFTGKEPDKNLVNSLAYQAEKHFHGTPSGADNTTCCFGGLIFYRKEFEFLKTISALNCKLPAEFESQMFLVDTGKPEESTAQMVKEVSQRYNSSPEETDEVLCKIEKITKRMVVSIIKEDLSGFRKAIADNQECLVKLGVVSKQSQELVAALGELGVGKITGAGGAAAGSGYVLFVANNAEEAREYFQKNNIPYLPFHQDFHGVQYQKSS